MFKKKLSCLLCLLMTSVLCNLVFAETKEDDDLDVVQYSERFIDLEIIKLKSWVWLIRNHRERGKDVVTMLDCLISQGANNFDMYLRELSKSNAERRNDSDKVAMEKLIVIQEELIEYWEKYEKVSCDDNYEIAEKLK